jgi:integrase
MPSAQGLSSSPLQVGYSALTFYKRTVHTLLGHKDLRMTMRYFHLSPEHLKEAIQNLDKSLTLKEGFRENSFQQSIP